MRRTQDRPGERGQILVLFAGGMIGLLAIVALAVDLSSVYSRSRPLAPPRTLRRSPAGRTFSKRGLATVGRAEQVGSAACARRPGGAFRRPSADRIRLRSTVLSSIAS